MSNALAIAAVTQALMQLISTEVSVDPTGDVPPGIKITAAPPDAANNDTATHQVNLFLYHIMPNAAWRNMPIPGRVKSGETGAPPLALNLYYMVTAYAREKGDAGDIASHNLLGRVMRILNDHCILGPGDITLPASDLQNQIERVRITFQPLTIEEIFRLWSGFLTQYRMSVAYEVSVVLIESANPLKAPPPVMKLGPGGRGSPITPDPFPFPILFSVELDNVKLPAPPGSVGGPDASTVPPVALLGDTLVISGHRLGGPQVSAVFQSQRLATPSILVIPPAQNTGDIARVTLPTQHPANWPAGFYTLRILISQPNVPDQATNALPFAIAPQIDTTQQIGATRDSQGPVTVTLHCIQPVLPEQRVSLLVGDQEAQIVPITSPATSLAFTSSNIPPGNYLLRLRVDGVDSFPFIRKIPFDPFTNPPDFDPKQRVQVP